MKNNKFVILRFFMEKIKEFSTNVSETVKIELEFNIIAFIGRWQFWSRNAFFNNENLLKWRIYKLTGRRIIWYRESFWFCREMGTFSEFMPQPYRIEHVYCESVKTRVQTWFINNSINTVNSHYKKKVWIPDKSVSFSLWKCFPFESRRLI